MHLSLLLAPLKVLPAVKLVICTQLEGKTTVSGLAARIQISTCVTLEIKKLKVEQNGRLIAAISEQGERYD
jgi:hypothetical protein